MVFLYLLRHMCCLPCLRQCMEGSIEGRPRQLLRLLYEIDEEESKHALALEEFGHQEVANAWVLLDEDDGAAAE